MEEKHENIYILFSLWLTISFLLLGLFVYQVYAYSEYLNFSGGFRSSFAASITFSQIWALIFSLILVVLSFLLVYGTYVRRGWGWIGGLMFSPYILLFYGNSAVILVGTLLLSGNYEVYFNNVYTVIYVIATIVLPFLAFFVVYLLFRPQIKTYFGKTTNLDFTQYS